MKPQGCRSFLRMWRTRACLAMAAGAVSFGPATAQESRSLAVVVQPARPGAAYAASPELAIEALFDDEKSNLAMRQQAVSLLGGTIWQADAEIEAALVRALRADPSEKVRAQAAGVFAAARYVTPKAFDALQTCRVGSDRDGFPGERSATVKAQAAHALQRHPTSGNPGRIAMMQCETALAKSRRPTLGMPAGVRVDGAEESSPQEKTPERLPPSATPSAPTLGRPVPTDLPPVPTFPATPPVTPTAPPPLPPPLPPPAKTDLPMAPTTASVAPKAVDGSSVPEAKTISPLAGDDKMTLRERRAELREMGLRDSTMKLFTEQVGAPPPAAKTPSVPQTSGVLQTSATATSASPTPPTSAPPAPRGFLGRLFGSRSPAPPPPPEQTPRSIESMGVAPISNAPPLRAP